MAEAIVLNQAPGLLSNLAQGAANFFTARRKAQLENQAIAYQHKQDAQKQQNWQSDHDLAVNRDTREQQTAADTHELHAGAMTHQTLENTQLAIENKAKQLKLDTDRQLQGYQVEAARLENKVKQGQVLSAADAHQLAGLQLKIKQVEAQYAAQLKALDVAQKQAEIAHANAGTAHENAETYRTYHPITANDREAAQAQALQQSLNPQGQRFADMLFSTNNPATRVQALNAIRASALPSDQKAALTQMVYMRDPVTSSAFVTPQEQYSRGQRDQSQARQQQTDANREARQQHSDAEQTFHDVTRGPAWTALPPRLKSMVHTAMVGQDMSIDDTLEALKQAQSLKPEEKAAIARVLGGS